MNMQGAIKKICLYQAAAAVGTKAANLAMGHLAGRQAGHHTISKGQGGVDVVDWPFSTATTGRRQANHWRPSQLQHKVNVVNHQVEHHRHVISAVWIGTVTARFKHYHLLISHNLDQFPEGGIEALDMAHLQQTTSLLSRMDQLNRLLLTGRDRLLDQHVHPGLQAGQTDAVVKQGGHGDTNSVHLGQHFLVGGEPAATELLGS